MISVTCSLRLGGSLAEGSPRFQRPEFQVVGIVWGRLSGWNRLTDEYPHSYSRSLRLTLWSYLTGLGRWVLCQIGENLVVFILCMGISSCFTWFSAWVLNSILRQDLGRCVSVCILGWLLLP